MIYILLTLLFAALAVGAYLNPSAFSSGPLAKLERPLPTFLFSFLALLSFAAISVVIVDQEQVGHLKRIYLGKPLPEGRVVAMSDEQGPQARILGPGFHFIPMVNFVYDVEQRPLIEIAEGQAGIITALDGDPLADRQFVSTIFNQDGVKAMLNAEHFLTNGGQRGPQLAVLTPGRYRLNQYLFQIRSVAALDVPQGTVAVIKSNVDEHDACEADIPTAKTGEAMAVPLVAKGCAGVQQTPLMPNRYYLNTVAYTPTIVPTKVQTWTYKGGYLQREVSLTVDSEGNITQAARAYEVAVPADAADKAVTATIEGWRVPVELRMLIQVNPADAPRVVASVGTLEDVEDKIGTPTLRSVVRNVTGEPTRKVLDLINARQTLEGLVERTLAPELAKAGVTLKEIRFGDPVIPPELLVARQREQLATQLETTYEQERAAQLKRVEVERARAEATEQPRLVAAEINVRVAEQNKLQLQLQGEGEKLRLTEIAAGQQAQVEVLGQSNAMQLAMLKEILAAAVENPKIVKVPTVMVGDGVGLEGAAAVLGASNIIRWADDDKKGP